MESNLRPLTLGEILDRTAQLYRTNFLLFAGIYAMFAGVVLVLNLLQIGLKSWLDGLHIAVWQQVLIGAVSVINGLLVFMFAGAAVAAINRAVAWVNLGEPATIRSAYASTLPRLGRYVWLMTITAWMVWVMPLLVFAALMAGFIFALLPKGFMANPSGADPSSMAGFVLAILSLFLLTIPAAIYVVVMMLRYSLAVPACVIENLKARKAIRRSIELSKGARGRIFVLLLLIGAIDVGLVMLTQFFLFVAAFKHPGQPLGPGLQSLSQVIAFFTNTFLGPIMAIGITLFYYDQRVRKEGYDIEWMMQAAGLTAPAPLPPPAHALPMAETVLDTSEQGLALDAHYEPPQASEPAVPPEQTEPAAEAAGDPYE